jgi:hypothetical protein
MTWKSITSLVLCFALSLPLIGQDNQGEDAGLTPTPNVTLAEPAANKVPGLSLPPNFPVAYDEGFITIKADCKGTVDWIVLTTAKKVKYKTYEKEIDISVPPTDCIVTVFCYGYVDGKLTRAARCDIKVVAPQPKPKPEPEPQPQPQPTPTPEPTPVPPNPSPIPPNAGNLIVTVVEDPLKRDPTYSTVTKWFSTASKLQAAGHRPFLKSIRDPVIKKWLDTAAAKDKNFADALNRAGLPMLIIQNINGKPLAVGPCPRTEEELFSILQGGSK